MKDYYEQCLEAGVMPSDIGDKIMRQVITDNTVERLEYIILPSSFWLTHLIKSVNRENFVPLNIPEAKQLRDALNKWLKR